MSSPDDASERAWLAWRLPRQINSTAVRAGFYAGRASRDVDHCVDCCCARSWQALGDPEYDGRGIEEHITTAITAAEERGRVDAASLLDQWALVAEFTLEARVLREAATKLRKK